MPINVTMPRLSDTMQQGTIVKWNVKEGQKIKSGDVVADIETDKATMELQSFDDGVIASLPVPAGQSVPVGTLIMVLAGAGEDAASLKTQGAAAPVSVAKAPAAAAAAPAKAPAKQQAAAGTSKPPASVGGVATMPAPAHSNGTSVPAAGGGERVFASPLARKIAGESGLDLGGLHGSGPGGRIVRKDVEEALAGGAAGAQAGGETKELGSRTPRGTQTQTQNQTIPLSNMRRVIAQRLSESKSTIPHYQVTVEVDMEALMSLRGQLNDQLAAQGVKLSVNDFIVRACALSMHQHPFVNARWVNDGPAIQTLASVNIGIAIALPPERGGGLVVATLPNADQAGLRQVSAQSKQLSEKARTKGLTPQEMSDSTFTISNLGMFGVTHFNAIINPPNVAILAVGAALDKPVVRDGKVVPGKLMAMTMSSDHRVVDGAMAAAYLATVREMLEKPATLLV